MYQHLLYLHLQVKKIKYVTFAIQNNQRKKTTNGKPGTGFYLAGVGGTVGGVVLIFIVPVIIPPLLAGLLLHPSPSEPLVVDATRIVVVGIVGGMRWLLVPAFGTVAIPCIVVPVPALSLWCVPVTDRC